MTPDQIIEVVTAFKNGKKIEYYVKISRQWKEITDPSWNFNDYKYRVKPEPMELWVNLYADGSGLGYTKEVSALSGVGTYTVRKAVLFREVIVADAEDQQQ